MSIRVIQWVWDCSPTEGFDRLLLLAIADNANHDGGGACPGMKELERKTRMNTSTIYKCRDRLLAEDHIAVDEQGGGRGKRTVYRVIMAADKPSTSNSVSSYPQGGAGDEKPSTTEKKPSTTEKKPSTPVALTSNNANNRQEPSLTNARERAKANGDGPRWPLQAGPVPTVVPAEDYCRHRSDPATCALCSESRPYAPGHSASAALRAGQDPAAPDKAAGAA